eukprot:1366130-Rhodomonas_salina.1
MERRVRNQMRIAVNQAGCAWLSMNPVHDDAGRGLRMAMHESGGSDGRLALSGDENPGREEGLRVKVSAHGRYVDADDDL